VTQIRLITPPKEQEETYPYRKVWQSQIIEASTLIVFTSACFLLFGLLRLQLPRTLFGIINIVLVFLPMLLWLVFSYIPERLALIPRQRIGFIFFVTLLLANAVGVPFVDSVLQPSSWLATESTLNRIIGYTLTMGVIQESLKYLVLRYLAGSSIQTLADSVAYSIAVGIAYATIMNLDYISAYSTTPDIIAVRVLSNTSLNVLGSLIVGYGLAQILVYKANLLLLPTSLVIACGINGVAIPIRAGISNAVVGLSAVSPRPVLGLGFSITIYVILLFGLYFLFKNSEKES